MSRSTHGTKKTTSFINNDSAKKIQRSETGRSVFGDSGKNSQAAHKLSWGVVNAIETNTPGRPKGEQARAEITRALNQSENLRIKSAYGNMVLDERRDARLCDALINGKPLQSKTGIARADIVYRAANALGDPVAKVADKLGNVKVLNPETGRTHLLKNHGKY